MLVVLPRVGSGEHYSEDSIQTYSYDDLRTDLVIEELLTRQKNCKNHLTFGGHSWPSREDIMDDRVSAEMPMIPKYTQKLSYFNE